MMKQVQQLIVFVKNKSWITILGIILAVLLIISAILRVITPDTTPVQSPNWAQTNLNQTSSNFNQISFVGEEISVPENLNIYQARTTDITQRTSTNLRLNFDAEPTQAPNVWRGTEYSVSVYEDEGKINVNSTEIYQKDYGRPTQNQAKRDAQTFYDKYLISLGLNRVDDNVRYLTRGENLAVVGENEAEIIMVPFGHQLEGFPVLYGNSLYQPVEIFVDGDGVKKVSIFTQVVNFVENGSRKSLSVNEAVDKINNENLGSIISVGYTTPYNYSLENIASGELESAVLEYRTDSESGAVLPYYRFSGVLTDGDGYEFEGEIITPAVEVD